jgi:hypothetical protein
MSAGDSRPRHRGLSHHTAGVLELLLRPVLVPLPAGIAMERSSIPGNHEIAEYAANVDDYSRSGLPVSTMGRSIEEDPLFFQAALAGGEALAKEIHGL